MSTAQEVAEKYGAALAALREAHAAELRMAKAETKAALEHIQRIGKAFRVFGPSSAAMAEAVEDATTYLGGNENT